MTIEIPAGSDPGLIYYRNSLTKEVVIAFFTSLTGSVDIALPILQNADLYDISISLAFALSWNESHFDKHASSTNYQSVDRGLFQLNSRSFPDLAVHEFFNPQINSQHGLEYLRRCLDWGGNEISALAMYNAGPNTVLGNRTPVVTLNYVAQILETRKSIEDRFERAILEFCNQPMFGVNLPPTKTEGNS